MKVPAFLGSSFAFLGGFATVAELDSGIFADMSYGEKLPYACGGIVVAGLLYLVLALIIKLAGVKRVMRFLPPVVTGPIIILSLIHILLNVPYSQKTPDTFFGAHLHHTSSRSVPPKSISRLLLILHPCSFSIFFRQTHRRLQELQIQRI